MSFILWVIFLVKVTTPFKDFYDCSKPRMIGQVTETEENKSLSEAGFSQSRSQTVIDIY